MLALSVAQAYKIIIEANLKRKILDRDEEVNLQKVNVADDLQRRLEEFRNERFASVTRNRVIRPPVQKEITKLYNICNNWRLDMALKKGVKVDRGYATVTEDDGVNYRDIAETMTELGFRMNHSSARNYVLRVMRKFVEELDKQWNLHLPDDKITEITKSPDFQQGIAEILHSIELSRKKI